MNLEQFSCTACGQCCRNVGKAIKDAETNDKIPNVIREMLLSFPHDTNSDGSCSKLTSDGQCEVYENRPTICNVDKMYDIYYNKFYSKREFYEMERKACNSMIRSAGLDTKYLIPE